MAAAVLILIGVVFLVKNLGWAGEDWSFNHWWALFILIPAIGSFGNAWNSYNAAGRRIDAATGRSLAFGVLFVAVTVLFLFDIWERPGP